MKSLMTLYFFFLFGSCSAQILPFSIGSSQFGGSTGVCQTDAFSLINNPATLDTMAWHIGVNLHNYYEIKSLNQLTLAASLPTKWAQLGVGTIYFGNDLANEQLYIIGLSKQLIQDVFLGANLIYCQIKTHQSDKEASILPQVGLLYQINSQFGLGFTARNPFGQSLEPPYDKNLTSFFALGGHYVPSGALQINFQVNHSPHSALSPGLGLHYMVYDRLTLSLGGLAEPSQLSAGLSFRISHGAVGLGSTYHHKLGLSPVFNAQISP